MSQIKNVADIYPLTAMQEGMLYHEVGRKVEGVYVNQIGVWMEGEVDEGLLDRSWARVTGRHELLRAAISSAAVKKNVQVVLKKRAGVFSYEDARGLEGRPADEAMEREWKRGFDLGKESLIRVRLIRESERGYVMIVTNHHIIMDGWCLGIIFRELVEIYGAMRRGRKERLEEAESFGKYIKWLGRQDQVGAQEFWKRRLEGCEEVLGLVGESGEEGYELSEEEIRLGEEGTRRIEERSREAGVTVNTMLQGAWGVLLQRYCGRSDVVYGAVISGRPGEIVGVENMVGLFINTVAVRIREKEEEEVGELLRRVQDEFKESEKWGFASLAEVQKASGVRGIVNHILVFENYPLDEKVKENGNEEELGFRVKKVEGREQTSYNLNVLVTPSKVGLRMRFVYNGLKLSKEFVKGLGRHLEWILWQMTEGLGKKVAGIELITAEERRWVIEGVNATGREYPLEKSVVELFEEQAEAREEAVAVESGGEKISFRELNERANALAWELREEGVGAGTIVGLVVERSVEMIIGIWGILKAGGAYLPMDAAYPAQRIDYLVRDSGMRMVLTSRKCADRVPTGTRKIEIDGPGLRQRTDNPGQYSRGRQMAYVIYTSGSTGKPKGVMVGHEGLTNRLLWMRDDYGIIPADAILQKTTYTFDVSAWELLGPGIIGCKQVLLAVGGEKDPEEIVDEIRRSGVSVIHFVPSMLRAFLESVDEGVDLGRLRLCFCSGEALSVEDKTLFYRKIRGVRLQNLYGPTEATVDVTSYEVGRDDTTIPIGKPVANTTVYVVDKQGRLNPPGVPGELWLGGVQVGLGYLNNEKLTREKFLPNPFQGVGKVYRTGDLVKWRADGNLEYLGRMDDQVKVRGYRIELGEVEEALRKCAGVKDAAVVVQTDASGVNQLCAAIVTAKSAAELEIREQLGRIIPEYMIPSQLVQLVVLPLTKSGKADRQAILKSLQRRTTVPFTQEAGSTLQALLSDLWKEVLELENVKTNENFFDIGGTSISAVQLMLLIRERLGRALSVTSLFEFPTIAKLALHLQNAEVSRRRAQDGAEMLPSLKNSAALQRREMRADSLRE